MKEQGAENKKTSTFKLKYFGIISQLPPQMDITDKTLLGSWIKTMNHQRYSFFCLLYLFAK